MEDLNKMLQLSEAYPMELERMTEEFLLKLKTILWGQAAVTAANKEKLKDLQPSATLSPQQTKKRVKRLPSLTEDTEAETSDKQNSRKSPSPIKSRRTNAELLATAEGLEENGNTEVKVDTPDAVQAPSTLSSPKEGTTNSLKDNEMKFDSSNLMPPPPAPTTAPADESSYRRPQRAAKLKSEKNLKEPKLTTKLRRPTNTEEVKIKLEHEQRASQMHEVKNHNISTSLSKKNSTILSQSNPNKDSLASQNTDDSVVVMPGKQPSIVSINSEVGDVASTISANSSSQQNEKEQSKKSSGSVNDLREIRVKIKREKVSIPNQEEIPPKESLVDAVFKTPDSIPLPLPLPITKHETITVEETSMASSLLSSTTNTTTAAPAKKIRKKKEVHHRPIKVERFSDLDRKASPVSTRTRSAEVNRPASVYEDAVEAPPSRNSKKNNNATATVAAVNETVNLGPANDATMNLGPSPSDATFCNNNPAQTTFQVAPGQTTFVMEANPNATITLNKHSAALADATFDVQQTSKTVKVKDDDIAGQRSFETAKDLSMPNNESLLTEDDSQEQEKIVPAKAKITAPSAKTAASAKTSATAKTLYKMPTRTNELFNPLVQSPVKMRVEAFENAAAAATEQSKRPLRSRKENLTPSSNTTPVIGKLPAPALGRFLTPTQGTNISMVSSAIAKKCTTSASKALPMPKSACASSLQRSNSTTLTKTIQRENSDDFRKGLHSLAEERKKQREQKHLLAAQQREAKERERAERMAKLAKEREEKRLLKIQQEKEQKKKELEEIQRKLLKQQEEEAAKLKAAKEREMLLQMKQQQQQLAKQKMMPPPPKVATKYVFEMLHEDDSTDDEDKVSYKRPPPPSWSRKHVRVPNMLRQEYTPAAYIDSFFSVQPMTPDLKVIFPNIDARHLKRNSSVLWSTPPRYSELPKY